MRSRLIVAALIACASSTAAADVDWSWSDGFFGDSIAGDVFVDDGTIYPGYLCDDCRDPAQHPMDYAAVAYNGYWGENPWMLQSQLGIPFRVYNLDLEWVVVWFENVVFDAPTLLPDTMDIRLRLRNGQILTFTVLQGGPDLPVGDPDATSTSCGCGGGGGDGDDDYADIEEFEWPEEEESGHEGVVEIIDPDEEGEFDDWIEEL